MSCVRVLAAGASLVLGACGDNLAALECVDVDLACAPLTNPPSRTCTPTP
ncbi:MAG: hypothetical protein R2939_19525 [Kofleriaceae bacterium]